MPWKPTTHQALRGRSEQDKRYDVQRQNTLAVQVRGSGRWQRLREVVLARQPLCADPFLLHPGRVVPAVQVDHIAPLVDRPDLAYTLSNLQGLCTTCHGKKTAMERRRKIGGLIVVSTIGLTG